MCWSSLVGRSLTPTDLSSLLDLCEERGVQVPDRVRDADWLTPWAVAARYGAPVGQLDRDAAIAVAAEAIRWAADALAEAGDDDADT